MNKLKQYLCSHKNIDVITEYNPSTSKWTTTATIERCVCKDCYKIIERVKKV